MLDLEFWHYSRIYRAQSGLHTPTVQGLGERDTAAGLLRGLKLTSACLRPSLRNACTSVKVILEPPGALAHAWSTGLSSIIERIEVGGHDSLAGTGGTCPVQPRQRHTRPHEHGSPRRSASSSSAFSHSRRLATKGVLSSLMLIIPLAAPRASGAERAATRAGTGCLEQDYLPHRTRAQLQTQHRKAWNLEWYCSPCSHRCARCGMQAHLAPLTRLWRHWRLPQRAAR